VKRALLAGANFILIPNVHFTGDKMRTLRTFLLLLVVVAVLAAPLPFAVRKAAATPAYTCMPTCESDDARFLSIAGSSLSTLADTSVHALFSSDATASTIELGIFDGNTGGMWDEGSMGLEFILYADPFLASDETVEIARWQGNSMPDNDWFSITLPNDPAAKSPSGTYFYHMLVRNLAPSPNYWNNFKVRSDGLTLILPKVFAFSAGLHTAAELPVIYPNYPASFTPTTYDGTIDFHFFVPSSQSSLEVWDGDMDYGAFDGSTIDADDADTPNDSIPVWAVAASTAYEGVASGNPGCSGAPCDDVKGLAVRRSPSVIYSIVFPDASVYFNTNPSGNIEWEQFRIDTDPQTPADYTLADPLPAGLYHVHMEGMDLHNLNAWRFPFLMIGVCEATQPGVLADPCKPIKFPFLIGEVVFFDLNGDGDQDSGEQGIPGVLVTLLDGNGNPVVDINGDPITAVTDADGKYSFDVLGYRKDPYTGKVINDGVYSVQVAEENFAPGGVLSGLYSTTGGEQQTNTVIDANVMTYNFGYSGAGELGDLVWLDSDGDGIFDEAAGELPLANVAVSLNGGAPVYTNASGTYLFQSVAPGAQTVSVDPASLPAGLVPTYDYDGAGTPNTAGLTLMPLQSVLTVDFGYQPLVSPGTGTIGYWKNHPEAWPVTSIKIGGVVYPRDEAIRIMSTSTKTDKTYNLFAQLVAAKLNLGIGNQSSCIESSILAADAWLAVNPVGSGVKSSSVAWQSIAGSFTKLDLYNNGGLCAPHRN
jgi:hypothetical protein